MLLPKSPLQLVKLTMPWRWLRTSNRYRFPVPQTPVASGMRLRRPRPDPNHLAVTTGQDDWGAQSKFRKEALREMLADAMSVPIELLAMRRQAMEGQWLRRSAVSDRMT